MANWLNWSKEREIKITSILESPFYEVVNLAEWKKAQACRKWQSCPFCWWPEELKLQKLEPARWEDDGGR
jgi:hypothetical protein